MIRQRRMISLSCILAAICCMMLLSGCQYGEELSVSEETTDGYVYYLSEPQRELIRHAILDGTEDTVWELSGYPSNFNYLVTDSKVFLIDDNKLYSINPDGSGKCQYSGSYASSSISSLPAIVILDDWIYACAAQQGQFAVNAEFVRLSVDGTASETIAMDAPSSTFFADRNTIYVIGDDEVSIVDTDTLAVSTVELNGSFQPLCAYGSSLYAKDGKCFSFADSQMQEGERAFELSEDMPLGGYNGYLFFRQESGTSASLSILNLKTGERESYDFAVESLYLSGDSCICSTTDDDTGSLVICIFDTEAGKMQ